MMPELRLVLIIVGALAIAALLFHGLWTSKKEGKSKFSEKSADSDGAFSMASASNGRMDAEDTQIKSSAFGLERKFTSDPLDIDDPLEQNESLEQREHDARDINEIDDEELPHVKVFDDIDEPQDNKIVFSDGDEIILKSKKTVIKPSFNEEVSEYPSMTHSSFDDEIDTTEKPEEVENDAKEEELEVIVLHVHCAGDEPFVGTKLFDSMTQNGLIYGDMDIFHRHNDLSGTGKVLFSVANMMKPGTLKHDDPATFTTKGLSFFMTLPCFGDPEQNFKLMLRTAQQIADDLGANVLDDQRNLMTPDKLSSYRGQVRSFKVRNA